MTLPLKLSLFLGLGLRWCFATMSCQSGHSGHLLKVPTVSCKGQDPVIGQIMVSKLNIKQYKVSAESLTVTRRTCATTYGFFGAKGFHKTQNNVLWPSESYLSHIARHSCQTPAGELVTSNLVQGHRCIYKWPNSVTFNTISCHYREGFVAASHSGAIVSNLGNLNHCHYQSGFCLTHDHIAVHWIPNPEAGLEYLPVGVFGYTKLNDHIIIPSMGLSFSIKSMNQKNTSAYFGNGFLISELPKANDTSLQNPSLRTDLEDRFKVLRGELAQKFQYVMDRLTSPEAKIATLCEAIESETQLMDTVARINPAKYVRVLLKSSLWTASYVGEGYLMAFPCVKVNNVAYRHLTGSECHLFLPVRYEVGGIKLEGFLNAEDDTVHGSSPLIECNRSQVVYANLDNNLFSFNGDTVKRIDKSKAIILPNLTPNLSLYTIEYPANFTWDSDDFNYLDRDLAVLEFISNKIENTNFNENDLEEIKQNDLINGLHYLGISGLNPSKIFDSLMTLMFKIMSVCGFLAFWDIFMKRRKYRLARCETPC